MNITSSSDIVCQGSRRDASSSATVLVAVENGKTLRTSDLVVNLASVEWKFNELAVIAPNVNMFGVYILVYSPGVVVTGVLWQGIAEVKTEQRFI